MRLAGFGGGAEATGEKNLTLVYDSVKLVPVGSKQEIEEENEEVLETQFVPKGCLRHNHILKPGQELIRISKIS